MSRKHYTPEQIIGKMREAEVALALRGSPFLALRAPPLPAQAASRHWSSP